MQNDLSQKDNLLFWLRTLAEMLEADQLTASELKGKTFEESIAIAEAKQKEFEGAVDNL